MPALVRGLYLCYIPRRAGYPTGLLSLLTILAPIGCVLGCHALPDDFSGEEYAERSLAHEPLQTPQLSCVHHRMGAPGASGSRGGRGAAPPAPPRAHWWYTHH